MLPDACLVLKQLIKHDPKLQRPYFLLGEHDRFDRDQAAVSVVSCSVSHVSSACQRFSVPGR